MTRETGWLIERLKNSEAQYWTGRISPSDYSREGIWDCKASEGVRFARYEDAAVVLSWLFNGAGRVTEHVFVDSMLEGLRETARQAPHCESCTCSDGEREGEQ